jgi:CubicO group peptidase (beta-lactamase class C family)
MPIVMKWTLRLLLVLALAVAAFGLWKREEIMRLMAVNTLFDRDRIVRNFSHMNEAFLSVALPVSGPTVVLPNGPQMALPEGMSAWMAERSVTSLVVLKQGALVHESYHLGTGSDDLRIGWSLSKSYISALTGIILAEGSIGSLDDRVIDYAPLLKDGAYHRATLRDVLHMSTGVIFDEDYLDYESDINRMGRVLALGGEMDAFASELTETFAAPGEDWQYVSIDTHVLGMVIRGATGRSITDLLGEKIIAPLGVERAPYYLTDGTGTAFALGGLNSTTRDFARFGQMFLQGGLWNGVQIVPRDWVIASTTASAPTGPGEYGYGYQWWIPRDAMPREYMGRGIYGQYLYINEAEEVVIALTAADPAFREREIQDQNVAAFRQITAALKGI